MMGSMGHFLLQVPGCLYLGHALARQILRVYVIGREINQSLSGYELDSTASQPEFERDASGYLREGDYASRKAVSLFPCFAQSVIR
jgi:hypothetical protein